MTGPLRREDRNGVACLTLDHGKANAVDLEFIEAVGAALDEIARDSTIRSAVLTGAGTIFSAGVDLFRVARDGAPYVRRFVPALTGWIRQLFSFPKPLVAAINGHAIAGGCVMACACDYRIMAEGPWTIGVPELRVAVPFPTIALEVLRSTVPPGHLAELVYLGRTYSVREARERSLVDEIVAPEVLLERAGEVADRLGAIPQETFSLTKLQLRRPALERAQGADDDAVFEIWQDGATHELVRRYLAERFGRSEPERTEKEGGR